MLAFILMSVEDSSSCTENSRNKSTPAVPNVPSQCWLLVRIEAILEKQWLCSLQSTMGFHKLIGSKLVLGDSGLGTHVMPDIWRNAS